MWRTCILNAPLEFILLVHVSRQIFEPKATGLNFLCFNSHRNILFEKIFRYSRECSQLSDRGPSHCSEFKTKKFCCGAEEGATIAGVGWMQGPRATETACGPLVHVCFLRSLRWMCGVSLSWTWPTKAWAHPTSSSSHQ